MSVSSVYLHKSRGDLLLFRPMRARQAQGCDDLRVGIGGVEPDALTADLSARLQQLAQGAHLVVSAGCPGGGHLHDHR